jgi:S1-C subfamily serine protease
MTRTLCRALCVLLFAGLYSFPANSSDAWPSDAINRTIEQTNFIVDRGCSGTLISASKGLILTNYHCIDRKVSYVEREVNGADGTISKKKFRKYEDVPVEQKTYDGFINTGSASYITEIVAEAKTKDLAVLKLKGKTHHVFASPLVPDGAPVLRGDRTYTVGNPLGNDATLVEGIISNANRAFDFPWTDGARLPVLQISGGLAGGNSGGALYNAKGFLIGVPAAGYASATHIGFAIPIQEVVKPFLKDNCLASVFDAAADDDKCRADKVKKAEKAKEEKQ